MTSTQHANGPAMVERPQASILAFNRRALIGGTGAALLGASVVRATESDLFPIVETVDGKLRGLVSGGIKVFKGEPTHPAGIGFCRPSR